MALTMYQAAVLPAARALTSLATILEKASQHAQARKIDPSVLLEMRLYPDMFALRGQIGIANDIAGSGLARLAGAEVPAFDVKDKTLPEIIAASHERVAYVQRFTPQQFEGAEDRTVTWQTRSSTKNMQGTPYLFTHVLPNLYFHVTTAYDILRQAGLDIGKQDYLGKN